jgi:lysozyme family protein
MDIAIVKRIQQALESKGFSPGTIDGEYGPDTEAAVVAFQLSEGLVADGEVGRDTAAALGISLIGAKPADTPLQPAGTGKPTLLGPTPFPGRSSAPGPTPRPVGSDLAHRIIAAMERKGYQVDRGPGEVNIVYVEGMNPDGTPNADEDNKWNDLRLLIRFEGGEPRIIGKWAATTEPGRYATNNPENPAGAARIEFGQYKAWQVGIHKPKKPSRHEGLRQDAGEVTVCRDLNKDGSRQGDKRDTGIFWINQHWGYDNREVDWASAGCLVGQSKLGHKEFMTLVKSDPRYLANPKHVFATTILPASDVLAEMPPAVQPTVKPEMDLLLPPVLTDVNEDVRRWQKLLGFSEEEQDGIFGAITEEAVKRFQRRHGLTVTGDMDEETLHQLGHEAAATSEGPPTVQKPTAGARPIEPVRPVQPQVKPVIRDVLPTVIPKVIPKVLLGVGTMNPLIALAVGVLPDILRAVAGDKAGTVAGTVTQAVTEITQTTNAEEARKKLETDPAAVAALQLKLAEIAAEQEEKRQQAQLALLKEQNEQEAKRQQAQMAVLKEQNEQEIKKRDAQLAQFKAEIEDTKGARSTFAQLALANNPMAWGAPLVSMLVTVGFFGILTILVLGWGEMKENTQVAQIVNITVGALAAAFATVVSFWLGSSQGSRAKDAATIQLQAEQTSQTVAQAEVLRSTVQAQAKQAEALQSTMKTAIAAKPAIGAPKPSNFRRCLDIVLGYEGGFSAEPGDPSGATQFGIGIAALRDFRGDESLGVEDLKNLGRDEACEIYRTRYWNVLRCDDLPSGVDLVVFDFAVDANAGRAARTLQQVVGAEADGSIGDATLAATKVKPARDVVKEMSDRRLEYYRALPDAASFIRGAMNRANAVEKAALDMIPAERANGRV